MVWLRDSNSSSEYCCMVLYPRIQVLTYTVNMKTDKNAQTFEKIESICPSDINALCNWLIEFLITSISESEQYQERFIDLIQRVVKNTLNAVIWHQQQLINNLNVQCDSSLTFVDNTDVAGVSKIIDCSFNIKSWLITI